MKRRTFLLTTMGPLGPGILGAGQRRATLDPSIIGANTAITGHGLYQAIDLIRELGFAAIEIHPMGIPEPTPGQFPGFQFDRLAPSEKRKIKDALRGFKHIATHLPFAELHYFSRNQPIAEFSVRQIEIALEATAFFEAELAVIHPMPSAGWTMEQAWPVMLRRFREWGDFARKQNFRLALETGYPKSVRDFVRLVKEIDHPQVGCTIDVGHQGDYEELTARVRPEQRFSPSGIQAYNDITHAVIDQLGSKIWHFHVHDIDPATWKEHQPLGTGFVDYPRLIRKLREINYRGLLVLEIGAPAAEMKRHLADAKLRLEHLLG